MKVIATFFTQRRLLWLALWGILLHSGLKAQVTLSGTLTTQFNQPIPGFAIAVSGTESRLAYTDINGFYSFQLPEGGTYEVRPLDCTGNVLDGVSTFDLVLMSKYLLGQQALNPYQIIACDADGDNTVALADSFKLRKLLLGIETDLEVDNWKFVPKNYNFPNPNDPFHPAFPESINIPNLTAGNGSSIDFIGIKIGDLNGNATLNGCESPALPYIINGRVYIDANENCVFDQNEKGMYNWIVSATDGTNTFYGSTNPAGQYQIRTLSGTYEVKVVKPNDLWGSCPDVATNVVPTVSGTSANFGLQAMENCPLMEVSLSNGFLRRCFNNFYEVLYCNNGTVTAEDAHVEIQLDPLFEFTGSSIPGTFIGSNTYSFNIGDVPAGDCGNFFIKFDLSCDAAIGQSHCTEAHIFPQAACTSQSSWVGPNLKVEGECLGDFVMFTITNTGANMIQSSTYIVIEDIVVMTLPLQSPLQLAAGESKEILVPSNGSTVRLEINQAPGHPWNAKASATVEGCGEGTGGSTSMGMVNLFPIYDGSPEEDIDCKENVGSFDPNDKNGLPFGITESHRIPLDQPIQYTIRFQNTGTDTAFTIIVRDTFDARLDPATMRFAGSSHPCVYHLSDNGVAEFVFNNIQLPDSNVNEPASHGYLRFSILPKTGLPDGSKIENQASIYFDFNAPVVTNRTWHALSNQYLGSATPLVLPGVSLDVFPIPTSNEVTFKIKGMEIYSPSTLLVFSLDGHLVHRAEFLNKYVMNAGKLAGGCYLYKIIDDDGRPMAFGKLIKAE